MRLLLCLIAMGLLLSCQKEIGFPEDINSDIRRLQLDSMRYTYIDGSGNRVMYKSVSVPDYKLNSLQVLHIRRIDTLFAARDTVVYVDKTYSYNSTGARTRIHSKLRYKNLSGDPANWVVSGNSSMENFQVDYAYLESNQQLFPNQVLLRVYSDSSSGSIIKNQQFFAAVPFGGVYNSRFDYYFTVTDRQTRITDQDFSFWTPYGTPPDSANNFIFHYNNKDQVDFFLAQSQANFKSKSELRAHLVYQDDFFRLMSGLMDMPAEKHRITLNRLLEANEILSNHAPNRRLVNQLKSYSLSSTDSTVLLANDGTVASLLETNKINGTTVLDRDGRIISLTKRGETVRANAPGGVQLFIQKYEFFYRY
jgi:hypothetical protein